MFVCSSRLVHTSQRRRVRSCLHYALGTSLWVVLFSSEYFLLSASLGIRRLSHGNISLASPKHCRSAPGKT